MGNANEDARREHSRAAKRVASRRGQTSSISYVIPVNVKTEVMAESPDGVPDLELLPGQYLLTGDPESGTVVLAGENLESPIIYHTEDPIQFMKDWKSSVEEQEEIALSIDRGEVW